MGKLLDFLKRTAGEASLHSGLGLWRQKVSAAVDQLVANPGGGVFNWAESATAWGVNGGTSSDITDAAVTHTSLTGRIRVLLEISGTYGESGSNVTGRLLVDGVEYQKPRFAALPETANSRASLSNWWILDVDAAPHIYMPRISNGGIGVFSLDPTDDFQDFVILSVEDVAAVP